MPRVSSAPEDAYHFKGSFQDGWGVITDAKVVVFQFPPATEKNARPDRPVGTQDPPALYAELTIQRYVDENGNKGASQPEQVLLSICKPSKDTLQLDSCRPGKVSSNNPEGDPEDCGGELGAEGNTLFGAAEGFQLNDKCKWMIFTQSLQEAGFKPAILKRTYLPDLVGLYAYFANVKKQKQGSDEFDTTLFVTKKIQRFPYEQPAADAAKSKGAAKKTNTAPAATASTSASSPPAAAVSDEIEGFASAAVTQAIADNSGQTMSVARFRTFALSAINIVKPPQGAKGSVIRKLSNEFCIEQALAAGANPGDGDQITLP